MFVSLGGLPAKSPLMKLRAIITTIQEPTPSVYALVNQLSGNDAKLVVAGDSKGPSIFDGPTGQFWPVDFLSLAAQESGPFSLARDLPKKHYARKNIAYLHAIAEGASCIYETDDDNAPNQSWSFRSEKVSSGRFVEKCENRWVNVYRYFSSENIWPRGLPLDEIRKSAPEPRTFTDLRLAPIQQGLVNGSADVDAIWRLVMDREFCFDRGASVYLEPGNWCPFNTQSTWWWPVVYPLLYIPSYCSFRMCDIWKSFVAQRCLWELGLGVVFHAPEVYQDRNVHDLTRDFLDEIPGYEKNREICGFLAATKLRGGVEAVTENFYRCYEVLTKEGIFPAEELKLIQCWVNDYNQAIAHSPS